MTTALDKAKRKLRIRDIGLTVERVIIPATGEQRLALLATHPVDQRSMRERKFYRGLQLRGSLVLDRNPAFWRKAHRLAGWLVDHVERFHGLTQHEALKKVQEWSGIGCAEVVYDVPELGKVTRNEAESLDFTSMDEGRFNELWDGGNGDGGWIGWLRREVFGGLDASSRDEVERLIQKPQP